MAITIGQQLGSYEITGLLGKGGMGEVYRARDTKLKRDVAIKILPEEFSRDADRVSRFQREAQLLASLNHPNVAAIYGLEDRAIIMELVEGPTLVERLKSGPLPLHEALKIAVQIANALEAAHEKGVVHRDLKPANIKGPIDGRVKVLDLGLATALPGTEPESSDPSNSPTLTMGGTEIGVILGTAAYMSPEQASGKRVDKRSDIWSFGVVLWEMLTGRRAFPGEAFSEIIGNVLNREPDWDALPDATPESIRLLVRRCLKKDPTLRLQDIGDARIEIEDALQPSPGAPARHDRPTTSHRYVLWIGAAVALLVGGRFAGVHLLDKPQVQEPEMRVEINTPPTSAPDDFALSPDGQHIVFAANGDGPLRLWLRALDKSAAQPMAGTDGGSFPFWSADNRSIGFFAKGKLYRIDVDGGPPQVLGSADDGRGGTWNVDGTILFGTARGPLFRIRATGGDALAVTRLDPPRQLSHRSPHFLPDGNHFLFYATGSPEASGIYLGSLDGEEPKRLTAADTHGAHLQPDLILFVRQGALVARRLDYGRGELKGDPVMLADAVGHFSVAAGNRVAYRAGSAVRRQLSWFAWTGKALGVAGDADANTLNFPELSPDGRRVAVARRVQENVDVWLMDLVRGGFSRFTFDEAIESDPVWSPDGSQIAFMSYRKGTENFNLYLKPFNGVGSGELLVKTAYPTSPLDWSPDGRFLLYWESDPKTAGDLWVLEMSGSERKPRVVVNTPFEERRGQFSPDSRWLAYETNESGRFEIVVQPFPELTGKWQVSTGGGTEPRWRADGKELYYIAPDGKMMAARVTTLTNNRRGDSRFEAGAPVALFPTRIVGGANAFKAQYAVSRDGRFLINTQVDESNTTPITLILNWHPERGK